MKNHIGIESLTFANAGALVTSVSAVELFEMQKELADIDAAQKERKEVLKQVFQRKFDAEIRDASNEKVEKNGSASGKINVDLDEYKLEVNFPKKVTWDQGELAKAEGIIAQDWKEDPNEYIDVTRKVSETKYKSWPGMLKQVFANARTEEIGNPTYKIVEKS